jgi:hypothetical protein
MAEVYGSQKSGQKPESKGFSKRLGKLWDKISPPPMKGDGALASQSFGISIPARGHGPKVMAQRPHPDPHLALGPDHSADETDFPLGSSAPNASSFSLSKFGALWFNPSRPLSRPVSHKQSLPASKSTPNLLRLLSGDNVEVQDEDRSSTNLSFFSEERPVLSGKALQLMAIASGVLHQASVLPDGLAHADWCMDAFNVVRKLYAGYSSSVYRVRSYPSMLTYPPMLMSTHRC